MSLVEAAMQRRQAERDEQLRDVESVQRATRLCSVCRTSILRTSNRSGVCWPCQAQRHSARVCACGCGRSLDDRNRTGYARLCQAKRP
jgi:hypothetical protein